MVHQIGMTRPLTAWATLVALLVALPASSPAQQPREAETLLEAGRYQEAEEAFRSRIDRGRATAAEFAGLGHAHLEQGELADAASAFAESLERDPGQPDVLRTLARLYSYDPEKRDEAVDLWRRALIFADDPAVRLQLAETLRWAARNDEALVEYRRLIDSRRADPSTRLAARLGAAQLLSFQGRLGRAHDLYDDVLDEDPENPDAILGLGEVDLWSGRIPTAADRFERVRGAFPEDDVRHQRRQLGEARVALEARLYARADRWLRAAEEDDLLSDEVARWRRAHDLRSGFRAGPSGHYLTDENDFERLTAMLPIDFVLAGRIPVRIGGTWARYRTPADEIDRLTAPIEIELPLATRLSIGGRYAYHDYDDADDSDSYEVRASLGMTGSTEIDLSMSRYDLVDRPDPFEPTLYNLVADLDVIRRELQITDYRIGLLQRIGYGGAEISGHFTRGEVTGDGADNDRTEAYAELHAPLTHRRDWALKAGAYFLDYDRSDPDYFSPDAFHSYNVGLAYSARLGSAVTVSTDHRAIVQTSADEPIGSQHLLEFSLAPNDRVSLWTRLFYLRAPETLDPGPVSGAGYFTERGASLSLRVIWP